MNTNNFLGSGWKFPLEVDNNGGIELSQEESSIEQSIKLILGTAPGERQMRPDFGCSIHELVFAPNNATTGGMAIMYVQEALTKWEPRIQVLKVDAEIDASNAAVLVVSVEYEVLTTNNLFNLVHPFYLQPEVAE